MSVPATAAHPLAASEVAYFHAHRFARERSLLDAVGLIHTETKYDLSELAEAIIQVAFIEAERAGAIRLARDKASRLFGLRKVDALFAQLADPHVAMPPGSLEARIVAQVSGGPREVQRVVHEVLGEDAPSPHWLVPSLVLQGLHARGLLATKETLRLGIFRSESFELPAATRALAEGAPGESVRQRLDAWRASRGEDAELLVKGVQKGVASRKEAGDGPD